jgi:hypothetical protein
MKNNETNTRSIPSPKSTMPRGEGAYGVNARARSTSQRGDGEDFAFNGQMGDGVNRMARNNVCDNRYSIGASSDRINMGLMQSQRKGNASSSPKDIGPSATRDKRKLTMSTASQGMPIGSGFHCPTYGNPDKINVG